MQRIIATGASGFIGRYAVERFRTSGFQVCSISRHCSDNTNNGALNIAADLSDCHNLSAITEMTRNATTMIHLAADITVPGNSSTVGNNISTTLTAIEIAKKSGVQHFVYMSSIPVIGDISYTPIDERHPVTPKSLYHWSKYFGEILLEKCRNVFETVSVVRIPSPVGVGMRGSIFLPVLIQRMMKNEDVEIYGEGKRVQNYIDVRDIADALLLIVQNRPQGLYLIAGEKSISNIKLANLCKDIIGGRSRIFTGIHADPNEQERWIISCKKAENAFDYCPSHPLEDSVRWIYANMAGKQQ